MYTLIKIDQVNNLGAVRIRIRSLLASMNKRIERKKKIVTYNPHLTHHYVLSDAPELREIEPGHFVRCNTPEYEKYLEELRNFEGGNE